MEKILFDKGWKYVIEDLMPYRPENMWGGAKAGAYGFGATAFDLKENEWNDIDLPYDYLREGKFTLGAIELDGMDDIPEMQSIRSRLHSGGSLEPQVAWFRKHFVLDSSYNNKNVIIKFDGVYRNCDIYLNEKYVGSYRNGYTYFLFDITDFLRIGENLICVRVDPREREGWWYEGGGIYRHVWLYVYDELLILPYEISVSTEISKDSHEAHIIASADVLNRSYTDVKADIIFSLFDRDEQLIDKKTIPFEVADWEKEKLVTEFRLGAGNYKLWDVESPNLYKLGIRIIDRSIKKEHTFEDVYFGIKSIEFTNNDGMYLNGRRLEVKGLCAHQDHAGVGIGIPDSVMEYRLREMKKMGMNAYRSAHHQPSDTLLELCDKMGILVFSETRRMSSAEEDIEQLKKVVKQGRNHASVFLWGIGNEEINVQHQEETIKVIERMRREIKKLDPTRPFTCAIVCWDGKDRYEYATKYFEIAKHLDIMGFNYCETAWDDYHEHINEQPIIVTEIDAANSSARGVYKTDENNGHFFTLDPDNACKCTDSSRVRKRFEIGEKFWKATAKRSYLAGAFLWTGIDYRGEPTPMPWPAVSSTFGILDYCGFRKDSFYYYQCWWAEKPTIHLFPHWNDPVKEGEKLTVYAYSNMDEVELFVNEKSYGKRKPEKNWYISWENVMYEPGVLLATGVLNGEKYTEKILTTKSIDRLLIRKYDENIFASDNISIWNIEVVDCDGNLVPNACPLIHIKTREGTKLIGTGNGDPSSHESELWCDRHAFNGKMQLIIESQGVAEFEASIVMESDN